MTRTKKLMTHWPKGGRPYAYRYHNHQQRKHQLRRMKRGVRIRNKYADEVQFMSISKVCGKFKCRGLDWMPGLLFGGKPNITKPWQSYQQDQLLLEAARKQLQRRGKLGVFMGHKDKHHLYKRELIEEQFGL